jgi:predicted nucleic acid-binding protein
MITCDTNVLVYMHDDRDAEKQRQAFAVFKGLIAAEARLGLQVIGEFQNVLRRKLRQPPADAAQNTRNLLVAFQTFLPSEVAAEAALTQMAAGRAGYWDALLAASAAESGCRAMLSEDLQDGAVFNGVEIVNPFGVADISNRAKELLNI